MIIGSAKSGTTTLYDDIACHPSAYMPAAKEPDILHRANTIEDAQSLYLAHFGGASPGMVCGEASTYYTMLPTFADVTEFARKVCGANVRLIYVMRDPIKRIVSHLTHDYMVGRLLDDDFDRAVREDPRYVGWSDYAMQARPWLSTFGSKAILFLSFEEYVKDRRKTMDRVFRHIGLDPSEADILEGVSNAGGTQRQLRIGRLDKVLQSNFYQKKVRTLLPRSVIVSSKRLLTRKRTLPKVELSADSVNWLEETFKHQRSELMDLGIDTFPGLSKDPMGQ